MALNKLNSTDSTISLIFHYIFNKYSRNELRVLQVFKLNIAQSFKGKNQQHKIVKFSIRFCFFQQLLQLGASILIQSRAYITLMRVYITNERTTQLK